MAESLRMRPFRNKGDVKRMMQRLFGSASRDQEAFDPITVAAMLSRADGFYGAFATEILGVGVADTDTWFWYTEAANALLVNSGGSGISLHEGFWHPGQSILPPPGSGIAFPKGTMTGWFFLPETIYLQYFDNTRTPINAHVGSIYSYSVQNAFIGGNPADEKNLIPLARYVITTPGDHSIYSVRAVSDDAKVQPLFSFPLLLGTVLVLKDYQGFTGNDIITVTMTGRWFFTPRLLPDTNEQNQ